MIDAITDAAVAAIFTSLIEPEEIHLPDPPPAVPRVDPDDWEFRRDESPSSSVDLFYEG